MMTISNLSQACASTVSGFDYSFATLAVAGTEPAAGDVFMFRREGAGTEIVIGFRPGCDKLVFAKSERFSIRRDGADAVIVRKCGSLVVLEGVDTGALTPADFAFDYVQ